MLRNPQETDKVKVLFVDQYAQMGGGQRILLDIVEYFKGSGIGCAVALPETGPLTELLRSQGVEVLNFTLPKMEAGRKGLKDQLAYFPAARKASRELRTLCQDFQADLIFCNGPRCVLPCVFAASALKLPLMCAVHLIFSGQEQRLLDWCFRRPCVKAVTFCSSVAAKAFPGRTQAKEAIANGFAAVFGRLSLIPPSSAREVGELANPEGGGNHSGSARRATKGFATTSKARATAFRSDKKTLVGNWVSPKIQNAKSAKNARHLFDLKDRDVAVGVVGRLSQKKGQRLFLEAMAPLAHAMPNLRLLIAGSSDFEDPEEEGHLRSLADNLGIAGQVRFLGTVEDTAALMDALDILVVPSVWEEPFGLVAVEGMARGLPVVACKSGGLLDIVEDGETGFLVEKKAEDIRKAVKCLISNPELRSEMGNKGLERARNAFGAEEHLKELRELACNLLKNG